MTTVPDERSGVQGLESVLGIEEFGPLYKTQRRKPLLERDSIY